jgi:hypothetical protein
LGTKQRKKLALPCKLYSWHKFRGGNSCDGLDLEGVYGDATLGNYEPKEVSNDDVEYTLEGVQADIVLPTSLEDDP